jgi:HSP20 family protein
MIVRWNPWQEMNRLQEEVNSIFDTRRRRETETEPEWAWKPAVDIYEDAERYLLTVEVPGMDSTQVQIKVEDSHLTLRGDRKLDHEEKKENYHRLERAYGTFYRSFSLPTTVDAEKISADYKQGLLKVSIPKKAEVRPKQISIKVNE